MAKYKEPSEWVENFLGFKMESWEAKELNRLNNELEKGEIVASYRYNKSKTFLSLCLKLYRKKLLNKLEMTYCDKNFDIDTYNKIVDEQKRIKEDIGELDKLLLEVIREHDNLIKTFQSELQEMYTSSDILWGQVKMKIRLIP